jgi:hypothetical protein
VTSILNQFFNILNYNFTSYTIYINPQLDVVKDFWISIINLHIFSILNVFLMWLLVSNHSKKLDVKKLIFYKLKAPWKIGNYLMHYKFNFKGSIFITKFKFGINDNSIWVSQHPYLSLNTTSHYYLNGTMWTYVKMFIGLTSVQRPFWLIALWLHPCHKVGLGES